jgi:hypothetical protein
VGGGREFAEEGSDPDRCAFLSGDVAKLGEDCEGYGGVDEGEFGIEFGCEFLGEEGDGLG